MTFFIPLDSISIRVFLLHCGFIKAVLPGLLAHSGLPVKDPSIRTFLMSSMKHYFNIARLFFAPTSILFTQGKKMMGHFSHTFLTQELNFAKNLTEKLARGNLFASGEIFDSRDTNFIQNI